MLINNDSRHQLVGEEGSFDMLARKHTIHVLVIFGLTVLSFGLIVPFLNVEQILDSLTFARLAKPDQTTAFHPHHLLYSPIVGLIYRVMSFVCNFCDIILAGQFHNIVWAVIIVISIYFGVFQLTKSRLFGVLAGILMLVSQTIWLCATQVEPYVPFIGCLALITTVVVSREGKGIVMGQIPFLSILLSLSIFYHQVGVLFCIPLGYYIVLTQSMRGWKCNVAGMVIFLAGAVVLSAYLFAYVSTAQPATLEGFIRFPLGFGLHDDPHWTTFNRGLEGLGQLLSSQLQAFVVLPWNLGSAFTYLFGGLLSLAAVWNVIQIRRHAIHKELRGFMLLWVMTYFLFFFWYIPDEKEFLMPTMIPLVLLLFINLKDVMDILKNSNVARKSAIVILSVITLAVFARNLSETMFPMLGAERPAYYEAEQVAAWTPSDCVIYNQYSKNYPVVQNLRFYFDRKKVYDAWDLMVYFYYGDDSRFPFIETSCTELPAYLIFPEYTVRSLNAYDKPSAWLRFMEWLFAFKYDENGQLVSHREYKVVTDGKKLLHLIVSSSRKRVDGLDELLADLDGHLKVSEPGVPERSFQKWLAIQKANGLFDIISSK